MNIANKQINKKDQLWFSKGATIQIQHLLQVTAGRVKLMVQWEEPLHIWKFGLLARCKKT